MCLEAEAKNAGADARRRLQPRIAELRKHRAAVAARLDRLGTATADAWDDIKSGFTNAAKDLDRFLGGDR